MNGIEVNEICTAAYNIGFSAAQTGPQELLNLKDVLGESGINDALKSIPLEQCESFAVEWLKRRESGASENSDLSAVLVRWGALAPDDMVNWYRVHSDLREDEQLVFSLMSSLLGLDLKMGLKFAEVEFKRNPTQGRRLFMFEVNSFSDPDVWVKLAERLPDEAKPRHIEFSEHWRFGRVPGPRGISAAAQCIADPEQRSAYLKNVLKNSLDWPSNDQSWTGPEAQAARNVLENLEISDFQCMEILERFDKVTQEATRRSSE